MSIWEVLGIAPTTDKAAIRHAYAQKTRTCHPEEDPEGFDAVSYTHLVSPELSKFLSSYQYCS